MPASSLGASPDLDYGETTRYFSARCGGFEGDPEVARHQPDDDSGPPQSRKHYYRVSARLLSRLPSRQNEVELIFLVNGKLWAQG